MKIERLKNFRVALPIVASALALLVSCSHYEPPTCEMSSYTRSDGVRVELKEITVDGVRTGEKEERWTEADGTRYLRRTTAPVKDTDGVVIVITYLDEGDTLRRVGYVYTHVGE